MENKRAKAPSRKKDGALLWIPIFDKMSYMTKKKNIVIGVFIFILIIGLIGVWFFNSPEMKLARKNQEYKEFRQKDLKDKNPAMYESLVKSIKDGEELVKNEPNKFDNWYELAVNYQNIGDLAKAEEAYKQALNLNKLSNFVWNNLAQLYIRQERYELAKDAYKDWMQNSPDETDPYIGLAQLYANGFIEGGADAARAQLQEGIRRTNAQVLKDVLDKLNKEGKI